MFSTKVNMPEVLLHGSCVEQIFSSCEGRSHKGGCRPGSREIQYDDEDNFKTVSFSKVYLAGSSLADITSKAESSFLANMTSGGASQSVTRQTFPGMGESWTGGRVEGGSWLWEGGAAWTADLAPPPTPGHCLLLGLGGGWGGAPCQQQRGALCELQPDLQLPAELVTGEILL